MDRNPITTERIVHNHLARLALAAVLLAAIGASSALVAPAAASQVSETVETDECGANDSQLREVTNPAPGEGGADAESTDSIVSREPRELREANRVADTEPSKSIQVTISVDVIGSNETIESDAPGEQIILDPSETDPDLVEVEADGDGTFDRIPRESGHCIPGDGKEAN